MKPVAALVRSSQHEILKARAKALVDTELWKGCMPDLVPVPVSLEPRFTPLRSMGNLFDIQDDQYWTPDPPAVLNRHQVWVMWGKEMPESKRYEYLIKQLQTSHRIGFEIVGNEKGITISYLCHDDDQPILYSAFRGAFPLWELTPLSEERDVLSQIPVHNWNSVRFRDYFTPPPYSHLLTNVTELQYSPLESLFYALVEIERPAVGIWGGENQLKCWNNI